MVRPARQRQRSEARAPRDSWDSRNKKVEPQINAENAENADQNSDRRLSAFICGLNQLIGIETVADPALPGGKRFCRAIRKALASPPEACVTRPDSSYVTVTTTLFAFGFAASTGAEVTAAGFSASFASRALRSFSRWRLAANAAASSVAGCAVSAVDGCGCTGVSACAFCGAGV